MRFMDARETSIMGAKCIATRSGYTGEDGFEVSIPSSSAREIVETLLAQPNVAPIGLGARDSLRLEAGLCLYGADLDEATTPVENSLSWAIQKVRRRGGSRAGGFPGADVILNQLDAGAARRRVGLRPEGRAPVRGGALLFAAADGGEPLGRITSGGFGPSVDAPIAMGYLPAALSKIGSRVFADLRGKREPATVVTLPFVKPHYKHR
jgi:aminomethyltransferase